MLEQTSSWLALDLHKPLTGLKKIGGDFNESTILRYIYTFLSLNYNTVKTDKTDKSRFF